MQKKSHVSVPGFSAGTSTLGWFRGLLLFVVGEAAGREPAPETELWLGVPQT